MDRFTEDYPGLFIAPSGHYAALDTGQASIRTGITQYYKVYGQLPSSWQDVVDNGIWQCPILGFGNELMDPDDTSLDFLGDIYLDGASINGNEMLIHELEFNQGAVVTKHKAGCDMTYLDQFQIFDAHPPGDVDGFNMVGTYGNNEPKLRQFAILGALNQCISLYHSTHGEYPRTLDDLFAWGVTPVDRDSINPVTGLQFRFDGSVGDIEYKYIANESGEGYRLRHVDEYGVAFTY